MKLKPQFFSVFGFITAFILLYYVFPPKPTVIIENKVETVHDTIFIKVEDKLSFDPLVNLVPPIKLVAVSKERSIVIIDSNGTMRKFHCHDSRVNDFAAAIADTYKVNDIIKQ